MVKTFGQDCGVTDKEISYKQKTGIEFYTYKHHRNGLSHLYVTERVWGQVLYQSLNWPAAYHDSYIFDHCTLFGDPQLSKAFYKRYGSIAADGGFKRKDRIEVLTPLGNTWTKSFQKLPPSKQKFSKLISGAQKAVENTFGELFCTEFRIVNRNSMMLLADVQKHSQLVTACTSIHNTYIQETGESIFENFLFK